MVNLFDSDPNSSTCGLKRAQCMMLLQSLDECTQALESDTTQCETNREKMLSIILTLMRRCRATQPLESRTFLQVLQKCTSPSNSISVAVHLLKYDPDDKSSIQKIGQEVRLLLTKNDGRHAALLLSDAVSKFEDVPVFSGMKRKALECFIDVWGSELCHMYPGDADLQWAFVGFRALAFNFDDANILDSF